MRNFLSKNILLILSILCFILSLFQRCYATGPELPEQQQGLGLLLVGWLGLMCGAAGVIWLANPLLILSWIFNKRKNTISIILGIIAIICSLYFLGVKEIMVDEAGHKSSISHYFIGYWLWITSMFVNLANTIYQKYLLSKSKN